MRCGNAFQRTYVHTSIHMYIFISIQFGGYLLVNRPPHHHQYLNHLNMLLLLFPRFFSSKFFHCIAVCIYMSRIFIYFSVMFETFCWSKVISLEMTTPGYSDFVMTIVGCSKIFTNPAGCKGNPLKEQSTTTTTIIRKSKNSKESNKILIS